MGGRCAVYPMDVETRREFAADRAAALARSAHEATPTGVRTRQRVGLWLVDVGLRLACERPLLSRA
jgi:hypothetical protein